MTSSKVAVLSQGQSVPGNEKSVANSKLSRLPSSLGMTSVLRDRPEGGVGRVSRLPPLRSLFLREIYKRKSGGRNYSPYHSGWSRGHKQWSSLSLMTQSRLPSPSAPLWPGELPDGRSQFLIPEESEPPVSGSSCCTHLPALKIEHRSTKRHSSVIWVPSILSPCSAHPSAPS